MKISVLASISLALLLMTSCSHVDSKETVLQSAWEIYSKANVEPQDMTVFTTSFNKLVDKVSKVDEGAELGYFDHILLSQAQDDIEVADIKVVNITKDEANVRVVKSTGDTLRVVLKKEDGVWKVDDVNNERKQMTDYCKSMGNGNLQ